MSQYVFFQVSLLNRSRPFGDSVTTHSTCMHLNVNIWDQFVSAATGVARHMIMSSETRQSCWEVGLSYCAEIEGD